MIDIYGNDIHFNINEGLMTKNFAVVAGTKEIVESFRKTLI
jgi:hypothetical protein